MPNFGKTEDQLETRLDKWLYFIRYLVDFQEIPRIFGGEDIFTQAFVKAELANLNREEQASYQTSLKVYRDWKSVIDTARDEGREEGREEGRRAAMAEALAGHQASGMPEAEARRLLGITG